ncbi:MAG: POTRA domain-containing protein [Bacteroidota bacterium]
MIFKWSTFTYFIAALWSTLVAQNNIKSIEFAGLKRTETSYLEQFLQSREKEPLDTEKLANDVQQLKNIASIGNATYRLDTVGDQINLVYEVLELKTLLPVVNFGGIKGNTWFQVGFTDINWRGKGHFLNAAYQNNDRRHSWNVYHKIPRINASPWGYSGSISHWASREPLFFDEGTVNYDYDNTGFGLTGIRHFGFRRNVEFGGTYFIEKYQKSALQFLEITPGPDELTQPKFLIKTAYTEDFLNYHLFYLDGYHWHGLLQQVYNTLDNSWFNSFQFQGRYFKRMGNRGNLATRLRLAIATNNDTPFAPFVVDSHVNIRGVGNRIDRGTAQAVLNIEYRHTLLETNKWGAQVVGFSDLGSWRNPGGKLIDIFDSDQFRHFLGGGVRIIYQKIFGAVIRIDYGIDVYNTRQRGFVIGLGQYF